MTTALFVETLVSVSNSPIQNYVHPIDHARPTCTYRLIVSNDVWGALVPPPPPPLLFQFNKSVIIDLKQRPVSVALKKAHS